MRMITIALLTHLVTVPATAQQIESKQEANTPSSHRPAPESDTWGIEVDLVRPWVPEAHIISFNLTRRLWASSGDLRGDLLLGAYLRPDVEHDIVETIDEYLAIVGYRQYLWKGLHVEGAVLAGWAWGHNNLIDGKDYSNPAVLLEGLLGYRLNLREPYDSQGAPRIGIHVAPQVGVIAGVLTDIGPRGGKSDVFLDAKLLAGVTF